MNNIKTDETRTCKECSKPYQHVASYWDTDYRTDWNADVYNCPACAHIVKEREKEEEVAREEEMRRQAKEDAAKANWLATVPPLYRETDISHPDYPKETHRKVIEWQKSREAGEGSARLFLGLIGESGRCKTRVISQVVKRMIWNGDTCQWINAADLQVLAQNQFNREKSARMSAWGHHRTIGDEAKAKLKSFRTCGVLIIDDLGKGTLTETVAGVLYSIIEDRTAHGRATLWTSNASLDDLLHMMPSDSGGPIVRRLVEFSTIIKA